MARPRRPNSSPSTGSFSLRVLAPVPRRFAARTVINYVPPSQYFNSTRYLRVPLITSRAAFRTARVTVRVPANRKPVLPAVTAIRRNQIIQYPYRAARLYELIEPNRRRNEERKFSRRESAGQMASVRRDTFGMIGEAVRRGYTAAQVADVAMVQRSLERIR